MMHRIIGIHFKGQYIECLLNDENKIIKCVVDDYFTGIELNIMPEFQKLVDIEISKESK